MSGNEFEGTPPEILERAEKISQNLLPSCSKERYVTAYEKFNSWKNSNNVNSLSESTFLVYFEEISKKYKSSTLWSIYSMLKNTVNLKHNTDISKYPKLLGFLKRKGESYVPKKSKILTNENFNEFMNSAPNKHFLLTKAVVAIGLSGACRREELCYLKIGDVNDLNSALLVKILKTKNKMPRTFIVVGYFYEVCKQYMELRPRNISEQRFFLNYKRGKCSKQVIGINKIGAMAKVIATFLKLPNPEQFTGHCFRRSSATMLVNAGGNLLTLKRHGGWRSSATAEGYIDDSIQSKNAIANKITESVHPTEEDASSGTRNSPRSATNVTLPETSQTSHISITENLFRNQNFPGVNLQNCSHFTINYNFK